MTTVEELINDFNEMQEEVVNELNIVNDLNDKVKIIIKQHLNEVDNLIKETKVVNFVKTESLIRKLEKLLKSGLSKSEKQKVKEIKNALEKLSKNIK